MTAPVADPPTRDPARQPERTRLSWHRTVLTVTVVALLAGRLALHETLSPARLLVGAVLVAGWLAIALASARRVVAMRAAAPGPARWSVRAAGLVAVGYAALSVALVAVP
jgi:uncharacterized membrane protein YidH (DUF202 family)